MGASDPSSPLNDGSGKQSRPPEQLKRDAGAHDINDRIDCTHLVEMDSIRGLAMNLSFRVRDALENCDGFLLYPTGEPAFLNKLPDLSKGAPVLWIVVVRMRMRVLLRMCVLGAVIEIDGMMLVPMLMRWGVLRVDVRVLVFMDILMLLVVRVVIIAAVLDMDVELELCSGDARLLPP